MQIFYKNLCSKVIMLVVEASDTIESVRAKVKDPLPLPSRGLKTTVVAVKAVTTVKAVTAVKAVAAVGGPNWELQLPISAQDSSVDPFGPP